MKSTIPAFLTAVLLSSCATVDLPKGSSEGYSTARFAKTSVQAVQTEDLEDSPEVNKMIQDAIASQFQTHGITFGPSNTDLIVAFMLIRQNNVSTTMNTDYFGQGRDAMAIMDEAHERGVIKNKTPDEFDAGAIVVDILNAKSNELIYRHFAKREILENLGSASQQVRINEAVAEALEPFFR